VAHIYISAAHKSSGKTTLSVGLAAAMARRGVDVRCFKKGPDYIDPLWLQKASGRPCYNLDFNFQSHDEISHLFAERMSGGDIGLIEGNKGLYDGVSLDGSDANSALAGPVVLVINVSGITRGIAPLLLGYKSFGPELDFAGLVLNNIGTPRQKAKLCAAVEKYTDFEIIGAMPRHHDLLSPERHLGLVPPSERGRAMERIDSLAALAEKNVNLDRLLELSRCAGEIEKAAPIYDDRAAPFDGNSPLRIAIARDSAFGFYYADDLEALARAGAELVFFNALTDEHLPQVDGLFIGGGFPETHMQALAANASLRGEIRQAGERGLPIYAECGGLIYLARSLEWNGKSAGMVGLVPGRVIMHERPQGRGLARLREMAGHPWPRGGGGETMAHEFHYASLEGLPAGSDFAYKVERGAGIIDGRDGLVINNILAGFCHQRDSGGNGWARRFVDFVRKCRDRA
jgi:cobyrinic acid a,c-diamide synthase